MSEDETVFAKLFSFFFPLWAECMNIDLVLTYIKLFPLKIKRGVFFDVEETNDMAGG